MGPSGQPLLSDGSSPETTKETIAQGHRNIGSQQTAFDAELAAIEQAITRPASLSEHPTKGSQS
jgi:hypothetical protein